MIMKANDEARGNLKRSKANDIRERVVVIMRLRLEFLTKPGVE